MTAHTRPHRPRHAPSMLAVQRAVERFMQFPRAVPHGRGTYTLPGPNMTDLARALDVDPAMLRPVLGLMVEAGVLRLVEHGTYRVFVTAGPQEGGTP